MIDTDLFVRTHQSSRLYLRRPALSLHVCHLCLKIRNKHEADAAVASSLELDVYLAGVGLGRGICRLTKITKPSTTSVLSFFMPVFQFRLGAILTPRLGPATSRKDWSPPV